MPYATRFQHERDPVFQERMREKWRLKKRRQRRKRAAAAKKAKEEGKPVHRPANVFIRSREYPNKAMWLFDRELRQAGAQVRLIEPEYIRRMWRLKTTHFYIRTNPERSIRFRMAFAVLGLGVRRRGTLYTTPRQRKRLLVRTSYVDRGRPRAPQPVKVTEMDESRSKIDPSKPMGEAEKSFLKACAEADARKTTPEGVEEAQRREAISQYRRKLWRMKPAEDRVTPGESEKQRRLAEMRRALAESDDKEKTAKKDEA